MPSTVRAVATHTAWSAGTAARPRTACFQAVAAIRPCRPAAAAVAAAAAPPPRCCRTSAGTTRRDFLAGMFKCSAAGASLLGSMDDLAAAPLSRSLSSAAVAEAHLPRAGSGLPRSGSGIEPMQHHSSVTRDMALELSSSSNVLPLPLKPLSPLAGGALRGGSSTIVPPEPRVLQVCAPRCVLKLLRTVPFAMGVHAQLCMQLAGHPQYQSHTWAVPLTQLPCPSCPAAAAVER